MNATDHQIIIQSYDPNIEIFSILLTTGLIGITLIGILLTNRRMRASNDLVRKELEHRLRPILTKTGGIDSNKVSKIKDEKILLRIINNGIVPIVNFKKYFRLEIRNENELIQFPTDDENFEKNGAISLGMQKKFTNPYKIIRNEDTGKMYCVEDMIAMSPTEQHFTQMKCPIEFTNAAQYHTNCYFELKFEYTGPGRDVENEHEKYHYYMTGHFENGQLFYDSIDIK